MNVDKALKEQILELDEFWFAPPSEVAKRATRARDLRRLETAFVNAAARRPPRGRPPAGQSRNERTYESFAAFVFVTGEIRTFKMRHGIKRIPVRVTNAFITFA